MMLGPGYKFVMSKTIIKTVISFPESFVYHRIVFFQQNVKLLPGRRFDSSDQKGLSSDFDENVQLSLIFLHFSDSLSPTTHKNEYENSVNFFFCFKMNTKNQ